MQIAIWLKLLWTKLIVEIKTGASIISGNRWTSNQTGLQVADGGTLLIGETIDWHFFFVAFEIATMYPLRRHG
uniref:Uncharacterized protein n=1 Tax=Megaselia scalaris TaxID=36166 RepID=T1GK78_MEGSC